MSSKPSIQPTQHERRRGALAVVDQLIVSGTNFLSLVALGRVGGPEALGEFSLGFSVLIVTATSLRSLVVTPYAVLGHRGDDERRHRMLACVIAAWKLTAAFCLLLLGVLLALQASWFGQSDGFREHSLFSILVVLAIPCWSLRELARHVSLADMRFERALVLDVIASTLQLIAVALLWWLEELSPKWLMLSLIIPSGMVGSAWLVRQRRFLFENSSALRQWPAMWSFGRWGLVSQASHAIQGYALHWIVLLTAGLSAAGILAAASSIVQLANPFIQGVGNALTPLLARRRTEGGPASLSFATRKVTQYVGVASLVYVGLIGSIGPFLFRRIYGDQYPESTVLLVLLSCTVSVGAIALVATKVISVMEFPHVNCALNVTTMTLTIVLAATCGAARGIEGAVAGSLLAACLGAVAKWTLYRRITRRSAS